MNVSYHQQDQQEKTFWMTVVTTNAEAPDTVALWRCTNYSDGPACVQAKLITCPPGTHHCELSATTVDGVQAMDKGDSGSGGFLGIK